MAQVTQKKTFVDPPHVSGSFLQPDASREPSVVSTARGIAALVANEPSVYTGVEPRAYFTGGWSRDQLLRKNSLDIDIEVLGVPTERLRAILLERFPGRIVEPSNNPIVPFKILVDGEAAIDVTIPVRKNRSESPQAGPYIAAPDLTLSEAANRRDFTCNAIYYDPLSGTFHDPTGGIRDLEQGLLRVVPGLLSLGIDDGPIMRAPRMLAHHGLRLESNTARVLATSIEGGALERLPKAFITKELRKMLCHCDPPSEALRAAENVGVLKSLFPKVAALRGVPQDRRHHPEGDALEHTFLVLDAAATLSKELPEAERFKVMLAALFHDVGKLTTTAEVRDRHGVLRITAYGHERDSAALAHQSLKRLDLKHQTKSEIVRLIANHMKPLEMSLASPDEVERFDNKVRQLIREVHPANFDSFLMLCRADRLGRGQSAIASENFEVLHRIQESTLRNNFLADPRSRLLGGKDLARLGFTGDLIDYSVVLQSVEVARDMGRIRTVDDAEVYVLRKFGLPALMREAGEEMSDHQKAFLYRGVDDALRKRSIRSLRDIRSCLATLRND